jgi:DNA-binding response OmpR family regulator
LSQTSILIVEDDETIAGLVGFLFRREGFEVVLLRDGRAAEAHVASAEPPAVVVLDVMLPYSDGFAVAAAIRARPRWREVPIVLLTARAREEDLERGRGLGVAAHIVKPFQPRALLDTVKGLLEKPA